MVKPMYSTLTSTLRRDGLLSRHAVRSVFGSAGAQDVLQVGERQAGVDDVLDDDDVLAVEGVSRSLSSRTSPELVVPLA